MATERITLNQDGRQEVLTLGQAGAQGATGPAGPDDASGISIEDVGEYFTATDVEEALAEVGAVIAELPDPTTWLTSVKTATNAELVYPFTGTGSGIGGVSEAVGDRVLVKDQTDITQNGIWIVAVGEWTRSTDTVDRLFDNARVTVDAGDYEGREYRVAYNGGEGGWSPLLVEPYQHVLEGGYPHSAIDIPFTTGTYNTGGQSPNGTVKTALEYLDPALFNLTQHLADAVDAHDASAISATYNLSGLHVTGTRSDTVQKALNEFEVLARKTYPLGVLQLTLNSWDSGDTFKVTDGSTDDDTVITWHATDNAADLETLFRSDPWGWSWFANCIVTEPSAGVFNFELYPEDDQGYATNKPDPTEIATYFALWGETGGVTGVFSAVQPSFTNGGGMMLSLGASSGHFVEGAGRTKGADTDFDGNAGIAGD